MTVGEWLAKNQTFLARAGIATARLDCQVLLEEVLNNNRTHLLAHPETVISSEQHKVLQSWVKRRSSHEPLAYIRNKSEFYGYSLYIDNHVREPQPESEAMIDLLKQIIVQQGAEFTIIDIGTGSGALAVTAKLLFPAACVTALDIDASCLAVARKNASKWKVSIQFMRSDLLNKLRKIETGHVILLANLPYVPDGYPINTAATHEPKHAIFGGKDGLDVYRRLFSQLSMRKDMQDAYVLTEALPTQHHVLESIAEENGFNLSLSAGFIQVFRKVADSSAL